MKKYLLFFFCSFCFSLLNADDFEQVKVISVYDGDTFKVNLPCEQDIFCKDISVRINGIDTPEMKTQNSCEKAKAKEAQKLTQRTLNSGAVILKNCQRDKYFRLLCDVSVIGQNRGYNVAEELIEAHLAYEYYGDTKLDIDWCKTPKNQKKQSNTLQDIIDYILDLLKEILKLFK